MQFGAAARGAAEMGFSGLLSREEAFEIVDRIASAGSDGSKVLSDARQLTAGAHDKEVTQLCSAYVES